MTNSEAAKLGAGLAVTGTSLVVSRVDQIEQFLRMGASAMAILSGGVVIVISVLAYWRKSKEREPS